MGTKVFGSEFAIGKDALNDPSWFHMGAGYVVFAVALAGMVGLSSLLQFDFVDLKSKWNTFRAKAAVPARSPSQTTSRRTKDSRGSNDEY